MSLPLPSKLSLPVIFDEFAKYGCISQEAQFSRLIQYLKDGDLTLFFYYSGYVLDATPYEIESFTKLSQYKFESLEELKAFEDDFKIFEVNLFAQDLDSIQHGFAISEFIFKAFPLKHGICDIIDLNTLGTVSDASGNRMGFKDSSVHRHSLFRVPFEVGSIFLSESGEVKVEFKIPNLRQTPYELVENSQHEAIVNFSYIVDQKDIFTTRESFENFLDEGAELNFLGNGDKLDFEVPRIETTKPRGFANLDHPVRKKMSSQKKKWNDIVLLEFYDLKRKMPESTKKYYSMSLSELDGVGVGSRSIELFLDKELGKGWEDRQYK